MKRGRYTEKERREMRELTRALWEKYYDRNGILSAVERVMEKNRREQREDSSRDQNPTTTQEGGGPIE